MSPYFEAEFLLIIEINHLLFALQRREGVTKVTIWERVWREYVYNYFVISMCNLDPQTIPSIC